MPVRRYDRHEIEIRADAIGDDGIARVQARLTRSGVFPYRRKDGSIVRELRHPDDVGAPEHLKSLRLLPVTLGHPVGGEMVSSANAGALQVGGTSSRVDFDGEYVGTDLFVSRADAVEAAKSTHREISLGYYVEIVKEPGEYKGERYDQRQTMLRGNHCALVSKGRAGAGAAIFARLDADDAIAEDGEETQPAPRRADIGDKSMPRIRLDGVEYEIAAEIADKVAAKLADLEKATARHDALSAVVATRDAEIAALKSATPDVAKIRADVEIEIGKRYELRALAKSHRVDVADDAPAAAVRLAVIKKLGGAAIEPKLANRTDGELDAMLDVLATQAASHVDKTAGARLGGVPDATAKARADAIAAAREDEDDDGKAWGASYAAAVGQHPTQRAK